jgi:hypothetical protein
LSDVHRCIDVARRVLIARAARPMHHEAAGRIHATRSMMQRVSGKFSSAH